MTKEIFKVSEFNAISGEHIVRDMNEDELAEMNARKLNSDLLHQKEIEAKAAKEVAIAKLEVLGLTVNDLKALGL